MRTEQLSQFHSKFLFWFDTNKRHLPWRINPNWYKTYLSEIILQQTTVAQGTPYFYKFLKYYPTIQDLADAQEQEVLLHWAGLGYYSRARNMLKSAKIIVSVYNSEFPQTYKEALKLPGIGPYSASAILSISFGHKLPVIDGNVIRVISRLFSIKNDTRQADTLKKISEKASLLFNSNNPGKYNEAIMDLGAGICTPKTPDCPHCPVKRYCQSYKSNIVEKIPFRSKALAKHNKFHLVGVMKHNSKICIVRRPSTGLLAGMWEFPSLEVNKIQFENGFSDLFMKEYNFAGEVTSTSTKMQHVYSHIKLAYKAAQYSLLSQKLDQRDYQELKWVYVKDLQNYAIHNAHKNIIKWLDRLEVKS